MLEALALATLSATCTELFVLTFDMQPFSTMLAAGDDDMANDGIYTGTFSRYMGDGQYNVHCAASCQRNNAVDHDHEIVTMVRNAPKRMDDAGEEQDQLMTGMSMDYPDNDRDMATNMDHCCFVRHLSLGAFTVTGFEKKKMQVLERDMVPPAAVHDLRQVSVNTDVYPYQVTLQFSTTGDDMETGNGELNVLVMSIMTLSTQCLYNANLHNVCTGRVRIIPVRMIHKIE